MDIKAKINIALERYKIIFDFFYFSIISCLVYRALFFYHYYYHSIGPWQYGAVVISFGVMTDLIVCIALSLLLWLLYYQFKKVGLIFFEIILLLLSALLICLYLTNQKLFTTLFTGVTYTLLRSNLTHGVSISDLGMYVSVTEIFVFISLIGIYAVLRATRWQYNLRLFAFILAPICLIAMVYGAINLKKTTENPTRRFQILFENPVLVLMESYRNSLNYFNQYQPAINNQQQLSEISLIDPIFLRDAYTKNVLKQAPVAGDWNVVIFVLESVGENYVLTDSQRHSVPMPFLKSLIPKSVWFENNYSTGNNSPLGQFGLLTGLYASPYPGHFEMRDNLVIPSLASWLRPRYQSLFVSSSNDIYFAIGLNKTFTQYDNAKVIDPTERALFFNMFLDERKSFDYFQQQLAKKTSPYLAVYWSGAAHFPYKNYSVPRIHLNDSYDRYLTGLKLLDDEIKQVYDSLKKRGTLDHTIFVVIGDHGESFGQHDQVYVHGSSLYEEEIKVPLLIFAPQLLKPTIIKSVTTTADLVPTLLSALQMKTPKVFQGESLTNKQSQRKYIFIYGDEDEIAAIDQEQQKMVISFADNLCVAYDLSRDPLERRPGSCINQAQQEAILKFRHYQPGILSGYNKRYPL